MSQGIELRGSVGFLSDYSGSAELSGILTLARAEPRRSPLIFLYKCKKSSPFRVRWFFSIGKINGEAGIRTQGPLRITCSPDMPVRPLRHLSKTLYYFYLNIPVVFPSVPASIARFRFHEMFSVLEQIYYRQRVGKSQQAERDHYHLPCRRNRLGG